MHPSERKCSECGERLSGRSDKRFCDDQCRSAYNNRDKADVNNYMRNVNHLLRKNRKILASLLKDTSITVPRDQLTELGFSFNYFTHLYEHKNKHFRFCYEFGYVKSGKNHLTIVKRPDQAD
jgi:hypothetical protein